MRTLTSLRDDALAAVFARVPRASHDALRVCCKRLNRVGERRAISRLRDAEGWAERAIIVAGGFWCLFCMWCINCCSCCKCCREKLPCCFALFKEHRSRGKAIVIVLFLFAAIAAS